MTKYLLVFLFSSLAIAGDFWKKEWKEKFQNRDAFVAHLRESKKSTVRSYIIQHCQEQEGLMITRMLESLTKDNAKCEQFKKKWEVTIKLYEEAPFINDSKNRIKGEGFNEQFKSTLQNLLNNIGYDRTLCLIKSGFLYKVDVMATAPMSDKKDLLIINKSSKDIYDESVILHELGHLMFKDHEKCKLLAAFTLMISNDDNLAINLNNILRKHQELRADSFAASYNLSTAKKAEAFWRKRSFWFRRVFFDANTTAHPPYIERYKNAKEIRKLLEAEQRWFNTQKADDLYGTVAYERAFDKWVHDNNHKKELDHTSWWKKTVSSQLNIFE